MLNRYAELSPDELARAFAARPVAYVPWGALEWHGAHLPLGLDGLVAEVFASQLAERMGGVLLPTYWLPVTPLPHRASLGARAELVAGIWTDLLGGLCTAGCQVACVITGHYAQAHELVLMDAAEAAMASLPSETPFAVLAGTPLALLGQPEYLDHAGRWETAQLQALWPDLVHLERLAPEAPVRPADDAVLGEDPRLATAAEGRELLTRAEDAWSEWIERLLCGEGREALKELYAQRRAEYAPYVERYYAGSWEGAADKWWQERIR